MNNLDTMPNWIKDIRSFRGVISTFVIEGNIYDSFPFYNEERGSYQFLSMNQTLKKLFGPQNDGTGGYEFLFYNLSTGFFDPTDLTGAGEPNEEVSKRLNKKRTWLQKFHDELSTLNEGRTEATDPLTRDSEIIRTTMTIPPSRDQSTNPMAIVIDFASRFVSSPDNLSETEISFFLNLQFASNNAKSAPEGRGKNTLILVVDKLSDIPAWFYTNNPNVRRVTVPNPDRETRKAAIEAYPSYRDYFQAEQAAQKERYIDLTDGMKIVEIESLGRLLTKKDSGINDVFDLISIYKYGFKDNKWKQIKEKLRKMGSIEEQIQKRVKGQERAVEKAVSIIKRSVSGVSGLQHSSGTKPKGILFLAGPTGTGKTELVKTVTKLLFEDERSMVRFDMSEYSAENSDQKLFGAPPGYVGYGQGGQLTNAVRANPFSVLLFDEIEKAHPTIMDKFLQILEDGRMTDGQGNTVFFSETMIFFTSNKGTSIDKLDSSGRVVERKPLVTDKDSYEEICEKVLTALKNYFKPEVYGRIGESNFVVFDVIRPEVAEQIADKMLENINNNVSKENDLTLHLTEEAKDWLKACCRQDKYMQSGGRGIGNAIEELYLNRMGDFLFRTELPAGASVLVSVKDDALSFSLE